MNMVDTDNCWLVGAQTHKGPLYQLHKGPQKVALGTTVVVEPFAIREYTHRIHGTHGKFTYMKPIKINQM